MHRLSSAALAVMKYLKNHGYLFNSLRNFFDDPKGFASIFKFKNLRIGLTPIRRMEHQHWLKRLVWIVYSWSICGSIHNNSVILLDNQVLITNLRHILRRS